MIFAIKGKSINLMTNRCEENELIINTVDKTHDLDSFCVISQRTLDAVFMRYFVFVICLVFAFGCGHDCMPGKELTKSIEYWVDIGSPSELEPGLSSLPPVTRKEFLEKLLSKVQKEEIAVFYYMSDTMMVMDKENVQNIFHSVDTEYIEMEHLEVQAVVIENDLDIDAIVKLKFLEEWYFEQSTNTFSKKVVAVCPMVEVLRNENEVLGYKGLFWIPLGNSKEE